MKWQSTAGPRQTKEVQKALNTLEREHKTFVERYGIRNKPETYCESAVISLFSSIQREDVTQAWNAIGEKHKWTVTPENYKAIIADVEAALPDLEKNRILHDRTRTPEDESKLAQAQAEQEQAARQHQIDVELAKSRIRKQYPWVDCSSTKSSHAKGAANLKRELELAFPGIKFSVKSDTFSGGDSIHVHWSFGPLFNEVDAIANQYKEGTFDGMTDSYNYDHSPECDARKAIMGSAKYVSVSRNFGSHSESELLFEKIGRWICEFQKVEFQGMNTPNVLGEGDPNSLHDHVYQLLQRTSFPAGAEIIGVTQADDSDTSFWCKAVLKLPETTNPQSKTPVTTSDYIPTLTINQEKKGLEIRFPNKPSQTLIESLKSNGWRWSKFSSCWWIKDSPEARQFAATIIPSQAETTQATPIAQPAPALSKPVQSKPTLPASQFPAPVRAGLQRFNPLADLDETDEADERPQTPVPAPVIAEPAIVPVRFDPAAEPQSVPVIVLNPSPIAETTPAAVIRALPAPAPVPSWKQRLLHRP